jgi:hypothetical protein
MKYEKPEVNNLGSAKDAIQRNGIPKQYGVPENVSQPAAPAYDLDD